jgi:beta-glucosidase
VLRLADRVGALGEPRDWPTDLPAPDSPTRKEQMTRLAAAGMTVLTNRNAALPLTRGQRVALIGRHAVDTIDMGGGSAQVPAPYQASIADGLTALLGDAVTVVDGVEVRKRTVAQTSFVTDPVTGQPGMHAWLYAADGTLLEERHQADATAMIALENVFVDKVTRVVLQAQIDARGPVEVGVFGGGSWTVTVGSTSLNFTLSLPGTGFAEEIIAPPADSAVVDVDGPTLVEATVEAEHPLGITHAEVAEAQQGTAAVSLTAMAAFGLIARPAPRHPDQVIADAAAAAAAADVAVVVVGLTEEQETESVDKTTLHLTGAQDAMVSAVAAAARRTVVVLNAATPVIMPWRDGVDAILWVGLPGQEGGHAVAAALLGDIEPTGRLVTTFPVEDAQAPAWSVTPVDSDLPYREGTFIGYRGHHANHAPTPAFWFGHGLGYSQWEYSEPRLIPGDGSPAVSVTVTNVGSRDSREVVQLYLQPAEPDQPVRLVGWQTATAAPGESVHVEIPADRRMWRRWNTATGGWETLPADSGHLLIARGLGDVRARLELSP